MKEDYLWNKTGADPEIERLENALRVFRYQASEPPALPAKIIPFERKTPRKFFRLAFACAACAAFVIVSLGVWFQFSRSTIEVVKNSTKTIAPQIVDEVSDETPVKKPDDLTVKEVETVEQSVERKIIKAGKVAPAINRQNKIVVRNIEIKKPGVKLTKEEKYAYDQLMLALSISSSKFKLVKDKVEGVEEPKVVDKDGR